VSNYDDLIATGREHLWQWRLDAALAAFEAALRVDPHAAQAHYLRGEALFLQRRLDAALDSHAAASRHGVARDGVVVGDAMSGMVPGDFAWMSHMLRGDFTAAWELADQDRERRQRAAMNCADWPRHLRPVWDGVRLDGRRVLVRCFHGLGDTIQFVRYVPLLAERARSVSLEVQPELLELVSSVPGIRRLYRLAAEDRPCAEFGCEVEIDVTELPYAFRATLAEIPEPGSALRYGPGRVATAARRLGAAPGRLKVGLVWASGAWKPERSIPLQRLEPLAAVAGVTFVSLQRGPEAGRWRQAGGGPPMLGDLASDDVAETAALIGALDLVITADTMVAHLAGALGVPVWVMLHSAADWRWLLASSDSPWYPTMRLFRQPAPGDWASVVADIGDALAGLVEAGSISPAAARAVRRLDACDAAPPRR
jgi:hypothetical protein